MFACFCLLSWLTIKLQREFTTRERAWDDINRRLMGQLTMNNLMEKGDEQVSMSAVRVALGAAAHAAASRESVQAGTPAGKMQATPGMKGADEKALRGTSRF